jgi:hypothetical protein
MADIGPPRCGAKPVPKMTPASQRSASATIFSRTHATASLSAGSTSLSARGLRSTEPLPLDFCALPFDQV